MIAHAHLQIYTNVHIILLCARLYILVCVYVCLGEHVCMYVSFSVCKDIMKITECRTV